MVKVELNRFRGFEYLEFRPAGNVFLVGEPRAGRTTILAALRKVLDPSSTRVRPSLWDVHRPMAALNEGTPYPLTTVEVTLVELDEAIEQELDERIELIDPVTGGLASLNDATMVLGLRLRYCLQYNAADESLEHWVEYSKTGARLTKSNRELVQAVIIDRTAPLQLRVGGGFRALASSQDEDRLNTTLAAFTEDVHSATETLSASDTVMEALQSMSGRGASHALGVTREEFESGVGFAAEDGSISGLLRAVQATLNLDDAGPLPITSHGSTAATILAITEAIAASKSGGKVLIVDDFGDALDSASADFLARMIRRHANQVWMATRRSEAYGGFAAEEIARVSLRAGKPAVHQLGTNQSRQERTRRRYLSQLLSSAMSARTVVLTEGPHDSEGYGALDARLLMDANKAPLSARGAQVVPASVTGSDGGKDRLPALAALAKELGFAVRVVLDNDKPGTDDDLINKLTQNCEVVVHLPQRVAVERALVYGLPKDELRAALAILNDDFELGLRIDQIGEGDLEKSAAMALKQKGGLHKIWIALLPKGTVPPIGEQVLKALKGKAPQDPLVAITAP